MATIDEILDFGKKLLFDNLFIGKYPIGLQKNYKRYQHRSVIIVILITIAFVGLLVSFMFTRNYWFVVLLICTCLFAFYMKHIQRKRFVRLYTPVIERYYQKYVSSQFSKAINTETRYRLLYEIIANIRSELLVEYLEKHQVPQDFQRLNELKLRIKNKINYRTRWIDRYKWVAQWLRIAPGLIASGWIGVLASDVKTSHQFNVFNVFLVFLVVILTCSAILMESQVRSFLYDFNYRTYKYDALINTLDTLIEKCPIGRTEVKKS